VSCVCGPSGNCDWKWQKLAKSCRPLLPVRSAHDQRLAKRAGQKWLAQSGESERNSLGQMMFCVPFFPPKLAPSVRSAHLLTAAVRRRSPSAGLLSVSSPFGPYIITGGERQRKREREREHDKTVGAEQWPVHCCKIAALWWQRDRAQSTVCKRVLQTVSGRIAHVWPTTNKRAVQSAHWPQCTQSAMSNVRSPMATVQQRRAKHRGPNVAQ